MPKSVFYYHRTKLESDDKYADLKQRITELYHQHKGRYGYRRVTAALKYLGIHHNHKLIAKLMRQMKLSAKIRRQKYRSYKGQCGVIAKNLVKRRFRARAPNRRWLTDITELKWVMTSSICHRYSIALTMRLSATSYQDDPYMT